MSEIHYVFLMEHLQPQRELDGMSEVHFHWDAAAQTWRVTWKGGPVSDELAAILIAAAEALGMVPPEPERSRSRGLGM